MIKEAIESIVGGQVLNEQQAEAIMEEIMSGQATPAQIASFVTALRIRGETVAEIVGMARVMRAKSAHVEHTSPVVDTCGTGGDSSGTFNISTCAAFVAAAAGLKVAKHGNRAMSSKSGSADVLEALGVKIDLPPEKVALCLEKAGIGFMFAQGFHPAMKYAAGPRREIGIRTIFNFLGPLTNPAGAKEQLVGVSEKEYVQKIAEALARLGNSHSLIVHGEDGMDEISLCAATTVAEQRGDSITNYKLEPESLGFKRAKPEELKGGTAAENAEIIRGVLSGRDQSAKRDVVLLNAGAAIMVGGLSRTLQGGIQMAAQSIDRGTAQKKLEDFVAVSNSV